MHNLKCNEATFASLDNSTGSYKSFPTPHHPISGSDPFPMSEEIRPHFPGSESSWNNNTQTPHDLCPQSIKLNVTCFL